MTRPRFLFAAPSVLSASVRFVVQRPIGRTVVAMTMREMTCNNDGICDAKSVQPDVGVIFFSTLKVHAVVSREPLKMFRISINAYVILVTHAYTPG